MNEIEKKRPGLNEFSRVLAAIAEILPVDLRVKAAKR
jgi:hypothetical protein